jgi:hypothetical protein
MADDPIKQAARWRPRPATVLCVRSNGVREEYEVGAGRRAWGALRRLLPTDAIELVGLSREKVIVGRWQAPAAAARLAELERGEVEVEGDDDDPPSAEAATFRWLVRELRGIYGDQAKACRDALAVLSDVLKVQRDTFAALPRPQHHEREDLDVPDDDGYSKVSALLSNAMQLMAMQRATPTAASSDVAPPRESGDA